ncbi:MAG: hypothetical protein IKV19_08365 [Bacteroidaceae bacterium]|nr:hypothetical protein [Bacteroidaceae bacterium]
MQSSCSVSHSCCPHMQCRRKKPQATTRIMFFYTYISQF